MIGYWIVIAMMACAVTAVIVASVADPSDPADEDSRRPTSRPITIAALGASDATGDGANDPERENWIAQLTEQLPADIQVQSFAVGGSWLAAAYDIQVPRVIALDPDIVIGWLIVNDLTQGETLTQYLDIFDRTLAALARPGRTVLFANSPQLWNLPAFIGDPDDIEELRREVDIWNMGLSQVAASYGAIVVDLSQNPVEVEDLSDDGFHPSTAGHAKLAASFRPHVVSAIEAARAARADDLPT